MKSRRRAAEALGDGRLRTHERVGAVMNPLRRFAWRGQPDPDVLL